MDTAHSEVDCTPHTHHHHHLEAWFSTALDIEEVMAGAGGINCMLWLLMSSSPSTQLIGLFWIVPWGVLVCLPGSGKSSSLTIVRFGCGSSWRLGEVSLGAGMVVVTRVAL